MYQPIHKPEPFYVKELREQVEIEFKREMEETKKEIEEKLKQWGDRTDKNIEDERKKMEKEIKQQEDKIKEFRQMRLKIHNDGDL